MTVVKYQELVGGEKASVVILQCDVTMQTTCICTRMFYAVCSATAQVSFHAN